MISLQIKLNTSWNNWTPTCKKTYSRHRLLFTEINSKWMKNINVNCKMIKLLESSIGENLDDLGFGNDLWGTTPKTSSMKEVTSWTALKYNASALWKMMLSEWQDKTPTRRKYVQKTYLICLVVSYKSKHTLTVQSSNCPPWCLPRRSWKHIHAKTQHMDIYSNFIHNCQNLEATECPLAGV